MGQYSRVVRGKKKSKPGLVPEGVKIFIARRIIDSAALVLLGFGLCLFLAIISYDHEDPSMNTAAASSDGVRNWLGRPGAYSADVLLQTLGLGSLCFIIVSCALAFRMLKRHAVRPVWLRFAALIVAALAGAVAFSILPAGHWMTGAWLGGSGGSLLLNGLTAMLRLGAGGNIMVALLALPLMLASLVLACAVTREEIVVACKGAAFVSARLSQATVDRIAAAYGWIRHYGHAVPGSAEKPAKALKLRKAPAVDETASDDFEINDKDIEPDEVKDMPGFLKEPLDKKAPIKVVSPGKAAKPPASKPADGQARQTSFALHNENEEWVFPPLDLLQEVPPQVADIKPDEAMLQKNARMLQQVLSDFNVTGDIVSIHPGPVVTLYELEPSPGTKTSRVISLSDDIARSMSAVSVRSAVVPGRNVIGIELPNKKRQTVYMRELLETDALQNSKAALPLVLGKDIGGQPIIADLAKMPHLLVAGTTGSGKSVAVNTMILSLLYRLPPEKCRFIMIDPKMLELSVYQDIPHLLSPVVTEPGKAIVCLKWAVAEMENRYRSMSRLGVRNIDGYNARLAEARKKGETMMRKVQTGFDPETGKPVYEEQPMDMNELPYIVVIVDEFADLMLVAGKDVENAIQRLAQMARAAGIHLIMATQRPSVDVITGVIKANFPTRISFQVTSKIDSRTILGEGGAEQLLGMGDMLYMAPGGQIKRVHGPFVSDEDVEQVVSHLKAQGEPAYLDDVTEGGDYGDSEVMGALFGGEGGGEGSAVDEFYDQAVAIVARERKASTSFIQRHLQIGYNRAARIIEEMERQGVVTKANATGKRDVLVGDYSDA
jgi:S-DNA-T family DNA segregation ATPase FtsK/SpoIIIE